MKTFHAFLAITAAAALSTAPAQAQLLGGGLGGSMSNTFGGALNGPILDRTGTVDGRFGSDHSLRTADAVEAQPHILAPISRTEKTSGRVIENEKQMGAVAEQSAASKAESSGRTALNDGGSGVQAGNAGGDEAKSVGTSRADKASTAPPPRASADTRPAAGGEALVQSPRGQARADGRAANHTQAGGGTDEWSAGSQTAGGADASASVEH